MKNIKVADLAKYCGIDRTYATQVFKKEFGITIHDFIIQYKMQRAVEFLKTGHSVEEVSILVGFGEYTNFSRAFKKFYGYSPSKYKNILTNSQDDTSEFVLPMGGANPFKP